MDEYYDFHRNVCESQTQANNDEYRWPFRVIPFAMT